MRTFLIALGFFVVTNGSPIQISEPDFKKVAGDLLKETTGLLNNLNVVEQNIKNAPENVNKTISSDDYGISKNPQIIELEEQLKVHRSTKNISACQDLLEYDKRAMKEIFDFVFWLGVNSELDEATDLVNHLRNILQSTSNNLQGNKLDEEIKICTDKPQECKLTTEYPKEIDKSKKDVDDLENIPKSLIRIVENADFHKQVTEKISEEVYPSVSECIKKLKNQ